METMASSDFEDVLVFFYVYIVIYKMHPQTITNTGNETYLFKQDSFLAGVVLEYLRCLLHRVTSEIRAPFFCEKTYKLS